MTETQASAPYRNAGPIARYVKAIIQMIIGTIAVGIVVLQVIRESLSGEPATHLQHTVFAVIGVALVTAAAVELAYTLFTDGPDEALDPLMLALSAALILQLGRVEGFQWQQALTALLYVIALGGLFAIRKRLADVRPVSDWEPEPVKRRRQRRSEPEGGSPDIPRSAHAAPLRDGGQDEGTG